MIRNSLLIDFDLCIGCKACEVACKQENNIPVGPKWMSVIQVGPKEVGGKLIMSFIPMRCMHCEKPPCLDACPTGAIMKRNDGIVLINPALCIGCKRCIEVCPFGIPQINPETGIAEMCKLCMDRLEEGLDPACVLACPTKAITFGNINSLTELKQEKSAQSFV